MTNDYSYIRKNFEELRDEIASLAAKIGTKVPTLVAVTKSGTDEELLELEKIGYIKLGIDRIKRAGRINAADFKDVIEKLKKYDIEPTDSERMIIESYLSSVQ